MAGEPDGVRRSVRHLLDNAARHADERVTVEVGRDGAGTVTLVVDDDGSGVPEADRERIFERFVRLDEARTCDAGGAGLGLAVVRDVVAGLGGEVVVGDAPAGGARFEFLFHGGFVVRCSMAGSSSASLPPRVAGSSSLALPSVRWRARRPLRFLLAPLRLVAGASLGALTVRRWRLVAPNVTACIRPLSLSLPAVLMKRASR